MATAPEGKPGSPHQSRPLSAATKAVADGVDAFPNPLLTRLHDIIFSHIRHDSAYFILSRMSAGGFRCEPGTFVEPRWQRRRARGRPHPRHLLPAEFGLIEEALCARRPGYGRVITACAARWRCRGSTSCPLPLLTDRTGDAGKHVVRVASNKPDRAYNDHENHCKHHGILSDVLAFVVRPQLAKKIGWTHL